MKRIALLVLSVAISAVACGKKEEPSDVFCSYAPSQSAVVSHIALASGGASVAAAAIANAAGLTAVLHSSGAYIFTGAGGYLAGTLGSAMAGPVLVGVGVTVAGSAATVELLCVPKNHPELVVKAEHAAREFFARAKAETTIAAGAISPVGASLKSSILRSGEEAFAFANRQSTKLAEALQR